MLNSKFILCFTLLLIILLISETNGCMVSIAGVFLLGKSVTSSFFQKFRHPLYSHQQNSAELTPNPPSSSPSPTPPSSGCGNCLGFPWIYHRKPLGIYSEVSHNINWAKSQMQDLVTCGPDVVMPTTTTPPAPSKYH